MVQALKNIFSDLSFLYKNLLHWNLSKLLTYVFALLLGILLGLPFLVILGLTMYFDPINWIEMISSMASGGGVGGMLLLELLSNIYFVALEVLLLITAFSLFGFGYSYYIFPLNKLYFSYIDGNKLGFFDNIYFDFKSIYKYLGIVSWKALVYLLPFLVLVLLFTASIFSFGGIDVIYEKYTDGEFLDKFFVLNLIFVLLWFIVTAYLGFRMSYASLIYLDLKNYPNELKALEYIKESFKITSGIKIFKFLLVAFIFFMFSFLIGFIGGIFEELSDILSFIFGVFSFIFVSGLVEMVLLGTYKYIMLGENKEIITEEKVEVIVEEKNEEKTKKVRKEKVEIEEDKPKKTRVKKVAEEKPKRVRKTKKDTE